MEDCSTTCGRSAQMAAVAPSEEIIDAVDTLACLLTDTPEFQTFMRLSQAVRMDREVTVLIDQMNNGEGLGAQSEVDSSALEARLEALPIFQAYNRAEDDVRLLFTAVEKVISDAAGINFAENARPSACG